MGELGCLVGPRLHMDRQRWRTVADSSFSSWSFDLTPCPMLYHISPGHHLTLTIPLWCRNYVFKFLSKAIGAQKHHVGLPKSSSGRPTGFEGRRNTLQMCVSCPFKRLLQLHQLSISLHWKTSPTMYTITKRGAWKNPKLNPPFYFLFLYFCISSILFLGFLKHSETFHLWFSYTEWLPFWNFSSLFLVFIYLSSHS